MSWSNRHTRLVIAAYRVAEETRRLGGKDLRLSEIIYH